MITLYFPLPVHFTEAQVVSHMGCSEILTSLFMVSCVLFFKILTASFISKMLFVSLRKKIKKTAKTRSWINEELRLYLTVFIVLSGLCYSLVALCAQSLCIKYSFNQTVHFSH